MSFSFFSFSQELTTQKQETDCFIIYPNDIKKIIIEIDSDTIMFNTKENICDTTVVFCIVDIFITDDCISKISNADWSDLSYVLIDGFDYPIPVLRHIENLLILDEPVLYNLSDDYTRFLMFGTCIGFRVVSDFIYKHLSFFHNLISKKIPFSFEYNASQNIESDKND